MKKTSTLFVLFVLFFFKPGYSQISPATGAHINSSAQITKNLKTDFKAKGDGHSDDHAAFVLAAAFINKNGGNVKLIIPAGTYRVGRQKANMGHAEYNHPVYDGEIVLAFLKINNVSVIGSGTVKIIFKDSLKFGTFDMATGKVPADKAMYNPITKNGKNKLSDYTMTGLTGDFAELINCNNVEIKNLEVDGNSGKYILGGNWGLGENPIELARCYGIRMMNTANTTLENLNIHHFGVDDVILQSECEKNDTSRPFTHNILIHKVICDFAGRNGFSWTGGKNITVTNSSFSNSGRGRIKTSPSYGMDIEPEGLEGHILCTNGYFSDNIYENNAGLGLTPGTSMDDPDFPGGYGYSYNHYFKNCIITGKYNSAMHNFINRVTFDGCRFYGTVVNFGSSVNQTAPAVYRDCYFSDRYKNEIFKGCKLFTMGFSYKLQVTNCIFEKYGMTPDATYIYEKDGDKNPCDDDSLKPLFENCTFRFFPDPPSTVIYACNGRRIIFRNNKFYKKKSDNIRWANITGCKPGEGEGCVNAGNGLQYLIFDGKD